MPIWQYVKLIEGKTAQPKSLFLKKTCFWLFVYACHIDACAKPRSNLCSVSIGPILCRLGCGSRKSQVCFAKCVLLWKDAEGLVNFHWATESLILGPNQWLKLVLNFRPIWLGSNPFPHIKKIAAEENIKQANIKSSSVPTNGLDTSPKWAQIDQYSLNLGPTYAKHCPKTNKL
jgi:hypothetical protein